MNLLLMGVLLTAMPGDDVEIRIEFPPPAKAPIKVQVKKQPKVEEVVVTVDDAGWYASYKGQKTSFPRSTAAAEVQRLAGLFGIAVDIKAAAEVQPTLTFPVWANGMTAQSATPVVTGDRSHQCPTCGSGPWTTIRGWNPDGTHRHQCENCGTTFSH